MAFKMKKFSGFKELVGNQAKLDKNNSGSIDAEDFKMLRSESPNKIITYPTPSGPPMSTAAQTGIDPSGTTGSSSSPKIPNVKPQTLGGPSGNTANRPTPGSPSSISPVKPQITPSGPQHSAVRPTPSGGSKPFEGETFDFVARKKAENPYGGVDSAFDKKMEQVGDDKLSAMNQDERKKDQAKQSSALKMLGIRKKK